MAVKNLSRRCNHPVLIWKRCLNHLRKGRLVCLQHLGHVLIRLTSYVHCYQRLFYLICILWCHTFTTYFFSPLNSLRLTKPIEKPHEAFLYHSKVAKSMTAPGIVIKLSLVLCTCTLEYLCTLQNLLFLLCFFVLCVIEVSIKWNHSNTAALFV